MVTISLGTYWQCFSVYIHVAYFESKLFKYFWKMALLFKIEVQPLEVRQSYDFVILILVSWVTWGENAVNATTPLPPVPAQDPSRSLCGSLSQPGTHLSMSGDICGCHTEGSAVSISRAKARDTAKHPPVHRAVLQQHVAYVEAEKPCSKEIFLATLLWSLCPTRHCPFATPHI